MRSSILLSPYIYKAWRGGREVAEACGEQRVSMEVRGRARTEHRRRVAERSSDLEVPTRQQLSERDYARGTTHATGRG